MASVVRIDPLHCSYQSRYNIAWELGHMRVEGRICLFFFQSVLRDLTALFCSRVLCSCIHVLGQIDLPKSLLLHTQISGNKYITGTGITG